MTTEHIPASARDMRSDYPLLKAIYQHKADWNAYLVASMDDDDAPRSYAPSLKRLCDWDTPASNGVEAAEALRLALEFYQVGDSAVIPAMMKAALAYFDGVVDPALASLIQKHKDAYAEFLAAIRATDKIGYQPTEKEQATYQRTNDAEENALDAILTFAPGNRATATAKVEYLSQPSILDELNLSSKERLVSLLWSFAGGSGEVS